ncbi:MAG: hypothetical protein ACJ74H_21015 [Thermoanaerobaculia bacterium]
MPSLNEFRFRSSPFIDFKQLGELSAEEREKFRELQSDPDFYGLLFPRPPLTINLKAVARQTAELFQSLSSPGRIHDEILRDGESAADVVDLVLDGILEIESAGGFVSGADALPVLCESADVRERPASLSHRALLYAQDLETEDAQALTTALYLYNRIPLSPFWRTRFASREAILTHLGTDRAPLRALLDREWTLSPTRKGWLSWSSKTESTRTAADVTYKLYISPRPERIRDAFEVLVRVLSDFPETPFKIGDSAAGLLRPDKLVAYFATRERLDQAAGVLHRELAGCEAHGVPFTAAIGETALLSWGVDPPDNDHALQWLGRDSWRLWVAKRLGAAIAIAKTARSAGAAEPWRFAIERARRHGIDVETWTPSRALWSNG